METKTAGKRTDKKTRAKKQKEVVNKQFGRAETIAVVAVTAVIILSVVVAVILFANYYLNHGSVDL